MVSTTVNVPFNAPASVPGVQGQTIGPYITHQANRLKDRGETSAGQWSFGYGVDGWMSGEAACILNAGEVMKPQPVNKLTTAAFRVFEDIGTSLQGYCNSELSRFPTVAIGKASVQATVWLFCAVSSRQWFQGLGVSSRAASESLQAWMVIPSQLSCVSFCRGDESWSADQVSVALITSLWGNVRKGSNLLTRS